MSNQINIRIKQTALFPFKTVTNSDKKIFVKHFIYLFSLVELGNECSTLLIKLKKNNFVSKKIKTKTQILRSPNRHKIAQFHIARRNYFLHSSIQLLFSNFPLNLMFLINYLIKIIHSFESSAIFIKNIKINYSTTISLNKIYLWLTSIFEL